MAFNRISSIFGRLARHRPDIRDFSFRLLGFVTWIPAIAFFNMHVAELVWINGASMYPYLNTGFHQSLKKDICWVYKQNPIEGLQRGMLITFWSPYNPEVVVVKRVIALEGDKVYTRAPYPFPIADVPAGHIWVEGDNRDGTKNLDSNWYGPISKSLITGKVTHVLWPWSSFGPVRWWEFKGRTSVIRGRREDALQ